MNKDYNPREIEKTAQEAWGHKSYSKEKLSKSKDKYYVLTDECRGEGKRLKDNRPFLHYFDLDKKGYRYATNWEIL